MKLFEVMYPKCKNCGWDFSDKPFRDHRCGVCDKCAFPNKKKVKEGLQHTAFTTQIEELLWKEYQEDAWTGAPETYPAEMSDEDFLDFEEHIQDIVNFAKHNRITSPEKAIRAYDEHLLKDMLSTRTVH